ncbi:hypothetical protein [Alterisphingorhabdus coralli]|uniref:Alpha/beta hydrolase n=1 Tax=Alterisphingorhabdus coralli TaxID=3071408 RepID=A0AA97HZE8_9SPHN|nr:hypothetical protein [Parasphingorhabdus sp. SCSIO 66989]WOE73772.1 hypothetical protein RB602_07795 [Parasphingorhabdus sp. SCSIO 66989]
MAADPHIASYDYQGRQEPCLAMQPAHGADSAQKLCLIPPFFAEANRMRRTLVSVMRHLATSHGIASIMPDLPGTLESEAPLTETTLTDWQQALTAACQQHGPISHSAAFRAGAVLDSTLPHVTSWRLSPIPAAKQLRMLARTEIAALREKGEAVPALTEMLETARKDGVMLAGYALSADMVAAPMDHSDLAHADRTISLSEDDGDADAVLQGPPLWLRAEPGDDPELAVAIADDIARWMAG